MITKLIKIRNEVKLINGFRQHDEDKIREVKEMLDEEINKILNL